MADSPQISIVIPAFNEERRLPATLRALADFRARTRQACEVIIVVEKSSDTTLEIAAAAAREQGIFRVIASDVQRGKGHAVRTGMLAAEGGIIFFMDADLSTSLGEVENFMAHFAAHPGCDILVGNRQHAASRVERRQNIVRETMGRVFNHILRLVAGVRLRDTQCGFKAFRRDAAREIFARQKIDGFAFDVEVLLLAARLGFKVCDLPVRWINSPHSKVHIIRDSLLMLRDAFLVRRIVRDVAAGSKLREQSN
jgi:dolichyl-phosphate beta-glucosyltransferase